MSENFHQPKYEPKKYPQKNMRLSETAQAQLARLCEQYGDTEAAVVARALDALYKETFKKGWVVAYDGDGDEGYFDKAWHYAFLVETKVPFETKEEAEAAAEAARQKDDYKYWIVRL